MNNYKAIQILETMRDNFERQHVRFIKYADERRPLRVRQTEEQHRFLNPIDALDIAINALRAQTAGLKHQLAGE